MVNRGSQLNVDGNASRPVVMTSRNNVVGDVNADSIGQWGGLVILGRAPISDCAIHCGANFACAAVPQIVPASVGVATRKTASHLAPRSCEI